MRTLFTRKLLLTSFFFEEVPGDVKNVFMGGLPTSRVMLCLSITTFLSLVTRLSGVKPPCAFSLKIFFLIVTLVTSSPIMIGCRMAGIIGIGILMLLNDISLVRVASIG